MVCLWRDETLSLTLNIWITRQELVRFWHTRMNGDVFGRWREGALGGLCEVLVHVVDL